MIDACFCRIIVISIFFFYLTLDTLTYKCYSLPLKTAYMSPFCLWWALVASSINGWFLAAFARPLNVNESKLCMRLYIRSGTPFLAGVWRAAAVPPRTHNA